MHSTDRQLCALVRRMMASPALLAETASAQPAPVRTAKAVLQEEFVEQYSVSKEKEKADLERGMLDQEQPKFHQRKTSCARWLKLAGLLVLALLAQRVNWTSSLWSSHKGQVIRTGLDDLCPQVAALEPLRHAALLGSLDEEYGSDEFRLKAYESLGGAVRIPTETYDDLGLPSEDPRWEIHYQFHEYLEQRFPRVHANLKRTKVNTYALVYEWKGTEDAKPLLLAAHTDVVPVNPATYEDWINPPYSGYYDGEWIWGRGSCDDKPGVIGSLIAVETLLERGFVPSRTVLLAFGIDEERGGPTGARSIGKYLLETYGPGSIAMIVDEGGGYANMNGTMFAAPAVAEKGYMDVRMDVLTPGGHSSRPPKHTGIGILADLITELEANPHEPELVRGRTYYQGLECRARFDDSFPDSLRNLVLQSETSDEKLHELGRKLVDLDPMFYASSGTTQAVDLVSGGVKVNALPEAVYAVVNHRIADHSSLDELMDRFTSIVAPVATKHNMTLEAFGKIAGSQSPSWGTVRLYDAFDSALSPAPVTPTTGSGPYELLSGTILSTLETQLRTDEPATSAVVTPGISTGNTDTRHYWKLTKHIFRYGHLGAADAYNGAHTINEGIRAQGFVEQIRFFTRLILNADQSDLLD